MSAGYSGRPLLKKLGIKDGMSVVFLCAPPDYLSLLGPLPPGLVIGDMVGTDVDLVHLFVFQREVLATELVRLRGCIRDDTPVWISWPKKASKVRTSVTEDVVREIALPLGFVDIKVCSVSDVWSALKLVVRRELRGRDPG